MEGMGFGGERQWLAELGAEPNYVSTRHEYSMLMCLGLQPSGKLIRRLTAMNSPLRAPTGHCKVCWGLATMNFD